MSRDERETRPHEAAEEPGPGAGRPEEGADGAALDHHWPDEARSDDSGDDSRVHESRSEESADEAPLDEVPLDEARLDEARPYEHRPNDSGTDSPLDDTRPDVGPVAARETPEPAREIRLLPWEEEAADDAPPPAAATDPDPGPSPAAFEAARPAAGEEEATSGGRAPSGWSLERSEIDEEAPAAAVPPDAARPPDAAERRWAPPAVAPSPRSGGDAGTSRPAAPGAAATVGAPSPEPPPPLPEPEPEKTPAERLAEVAAAARQRRMEAAAREVAADSEAKRDYRALVRSVDRHVAAGYDLLGLVGYSGSGKTHFLKALSLLLKRQGFEVADWERLRRVRVPTLTAASVFDYPCTGPRGEKWALVDAGGELYARLRSNDWEQADASAGLLHSLYHCRGLFLLLHLQPGHLHRGSLGTHRWMDAEERERDADAQKAQEELEFFDHVLLFLRALKAEGGDVTRLVIRCAEAGDLDKALRSYRDAAPRLDIPVAVLFTQADTLDGSPWEVADGEFVSPRQGTVGVMPFVARHLPDLFGSLLRHARRFKFDFVQSYEEKELPADEDGRREALPRWEYGGEPLSVGALAALEFIQRNLPAKGPGSGRLRRLLRRFELETRHALRLDRWLHPRRWRGAGVKP